MSDLYSVTIDNPNMPEGAELSITGLGTFKNGEARVVTSEQEYQFRNLRSTVDDDGNRVLGPKVPDANINFATVDQAKDEPAEEESPATSDKSAEGHFLKQQPPIAEREEEDKAPQGDDKEEGN